MTGLVVAVGALFMDENEIYDLTNIGTLSAFAIVCIGVLVLRYDRSGPAASVPRPGSAARVASPARPPASTSCSACRAHAWERFGIWLALGLVLYFAYGFSHSRLRTAGRQ